MGVCVSLLSPGFLTICQIGPRLYGWGAHCLIWWLVTWLYHRGLYSLHSCSLCTCQISSITQSCDLQKFSDASAVIGCIRDGQEMEYRELADNFMEWCNRNHLLLHMNKTKEMVVDFWRTRTVTNPINIMGEEAGIVEHYKYLGAHLNNRLDCRTISDTMYKKWMNKLFSEEAQLLQCIQQDVGTHLLVCDVKYHLQCCSLLGEAASVPEMPTGSINSNYKACLSQWGTSSHLNCSAS